ncbi:MAG: DUF1736 domain-containing protein [Planctomycetota bacterium]
MDRGRARLWLAGIVLLVLGLYAPALGNGFVLDDTPIARATLPDGRPNPFVAELRPLGDYFAANYWEATGVGSPLYRPVTILHYALVHAVLVRGLGLDEAFAQHLPNLLLHALACLLVYRLLRAAGARRTPGVVGALLFGLHPIHHEVVAGIVGRAELLAFVPGALATLLLLRSRSTQWTRAGPRMALAALLLFVAFCAKESALGWLVVAPLMLGAVVGGEGLLRPWRGVLAPLRTRWLPLLATLCVPSLVFLALRASMLAGLEARDLPLQQIDWLQNPLAREPTTTRLATALSIQGFAAWKLAWPWPLLSDWQASVFPLITTPSDPRALAGAVLLALFLLVFLRFGPRRPDLRLGIGAFLAFGMPTANLLLPIGTPYAERLHYATVLLPVALVPLAASRFEVDRSLRVLRWPLAGWLVLAAVSIVLRNPQWRDEATLFPHDLAQQPRSVALRFFVADQAVARGALAEARVHLEEATRLAPDHAEPWLKLGDLERMQGRSTEAEACYRKGLDARWGRAGIDDAENALGLALVLLQQDRRAEARDALERMLVLQPAAIEPRLLLLELVTEVTPARRDVLCREGRARAPDLPYWDLARGELLAEAGRADEARAVWRRALPALEGLVRSARADPAAGQWELARAARFIARIQARPEPDAALRLALGNIAKD